MKKRAAVMAIAALTYAGPAFSGDHETCGLQSQLAEEIMRLRQEGIPMRDLIALSKERGFYDADTEVMVRVAYDRPAAQSEEFKAKQKAEFGNAFYRDCINE